MKDFFRLLAAAVLVAASPGLGGYQAAAQVLERSIVDHSVPSTIAPIPSALGADLNLAPSAGLENPVPADPILPARIEANPVEVQENAVLSISKQLAPQLKIAGGASKSAGPEASYRASQDIETILSGRSVHEHDRGSEIRLGTPGEGECSRCASASNTLAPASPRRWSPSSRVRRPTPPAPDAEKTLAKIKSNPPAAIFLDIDNTLTTTDEQGVTRPISSDIIARIETLLRGGTPVVINTGRGFTYHSGNFESAWTLLVSRIDPKLRKDLLFVGRMGAELVAFDPSGEPKTEIDHTLSVEERAQVKKLIDESAAQAGIDEAKSIEVDLDFGGVGINLQENDPRVAKFLDLIQAKLEADELKMPVYGGGDSWLHFKTHKGVGTAMAYQALRARGVRISEDQMLFVGDEFQSSFGRFHGADSYMLREFPDSRAVSVGDVPDLQRAYFLGGGPEGSLRVLDAVLAGQARLKASAPARIWAQMHRVIVQIGAASVAGAAVLMLLPAALEYSAAAAIGTGLLVAYGVPQLIENYRLGKTAAEKLSLSSSMGWLYFMLSALLFTHALLTNAGWWMASSAIGAVKGAASIFQINYYIPNAQERALSAAIVAVGFAMPVLGYFNIFMPAAVWASGSIRAALPVLAVVNLPQLMKNLESFDSTGRGTSGIKTNNLVFLLFAAVANFIAAWANPLGANHQWMIVNVISFITSALAVGQRYLPAFTNRLLRPVHGLWRALHDKGSLALGAEMIAGSSLESAALMAVSAWMASALGLPLWIASAWNSITAWLLGMLFYFGTSHQRLGQIGWLSAAANLLLGIFGIRL